MAQQEAGESPPGDFRGRILALRGRAGLGQRELAARLGVSERAVQAWEAGASVPSAARLQRLLALYAAHGAFAAGREAEEAAAVWAAALREAPRLRVPFDPAGFAALLGDTRAAAAHEAPSLRPSLDGAEAAGTGATGVAPIGDRDPQAG